MDQQRIAQFEKMAREDPDNELGQFSLGKAYLEAGRSHDAIEPLKRAVELRPGMSKAYQLLGEAYERAGNHALAVATVTNGATVADEQGDVMPRDTMAKLLASWGEPVPKFRSSTAPGGRASAGAAVGPAPGGAAGTTAAGPLSPEATATAFQCSRCGRPSNRLPKPPFKGPLGQKVYENVCQPCWREWIPMGTKVINELGLVLSNPSGQEAYDQYMIEFLQLEDR
jgi:Fe-S cluster biosynthesis and repair protein YggX